MTFRKTDVRKIAGILQEGCPFISFAMLGEPDVHEHMKSPDIFRLFVFIDENTGNWHALEKILGVMAKKVPQIICEVTLLNRVDAKTKHTAVNSIHLFVQNGQEQYHRRFERQADLDYRLMRAHARRKGIIDNE